jgi:small conductance mechanosensitive channel
LELEKAWNDLLNTISRQGLIDLLVQTIMAGLILVACVMLGRLLRKTTHRMVSRTSRNANVPTLLGNLVYVAMITLAALLILSVYTGTGLTTLLAALSVLSLALSLSLQDVLKNFVAGVYLLLEQPFSIGDRIHVRDIEGKVENIQIRTTSIRTDESVEVFVPNSLVFSEIVTNRTAYRQRLITLLLTIPTATLSFEELCTKVKTTLVGLDAADVSNDPEARILVDTISPTQIKVKIEFWSPASTPAHAASTVILALSKELPEAEITRALPTATTLPK